MKPLHISRFDDEPALGALTTRDALAELQRVSVAVDHVLIQVYGIPLSVYESRWSFAGRPRGDRCAVRNAQGGWRH